MSEYNIILDTDSYKASHWVQYPPNTTGMFSYIESRGGRYDKTVFFGLQYYLKKYLSKSVTQEDVDEAAAFYEGHGVPFNREGWEHIVNTHGGALPVKIRAVPEGSVIPTHNVLVTVESTDPKCFWLVSWLETMLVRIWHPINVATISWHVKQDIMLALEMSSDDPTAEIDFKLHDFGSRGVSSQESAAIGGAAHLVNFKGSDTVVGVVLANKHYNCPMAAFSIPASEHSTMTAWGRDREVDAYANMLKHYAKPGSLVACVSDSYDIHNACENLWGDKLRQQVIDSGATLIVRPDSGDVRRIVMDCMFTLDDKFGHTVNSKGYKVLNNVRVIQGDGIGPQDIFYILQDLIDEGYSATNIAFGMGGGLLQRHDRDTQKFAMKCSSITVNGEDVDVYKQPITDPGKTSKRGRLDLIKVDDQYETVQVSSTNSCMVKVFENGQVFNVQTLDEIRERAWNSQ